tara:strand:- start:269 stop:745 length:477 start_codon:yes stop_codon:yes gene_type:complete
MTHNQNPFLAHKEISKHLPECKGHRIFCLVGDQMMPFETGYWGDLPTPANDNISTQKFEFGLCGEDFMYVAADKRKFALSKMFSDIADGGKLLILYRTSNLDEGMKPVTIGEINDLAREVATEQGGFYSCPKYIEDPVGRTTNTGEPYRFYQCLMHKI